MRFTRRAIFKTFAIIVAGRMGNIQNLILYWGVFSWELGYTFQNEATVQVKGQSYHK